jgi:hypothetical protein
MTLVIVILSGFLGAGIGFGLGLGIAIAMAGPLGIAPMEGAQGYFAVAVGLVAGLIGMILAMILALRWRGVTQAGPVMMGVGKAFGGVLLVAALSFGLYWLSQPQLLGRNGAAPQMYFEISPPAGVTTDPSAITMTMDLNAPGRPEVYWSKDLAKTDDGQSVLTGHVELYHRASWRLLALRFADKRSILFRVRFPADPTAAAKHRKWSEWYVADQVDLPGQSQPVAVTADSDKFKIRYRVEFWKDPWPSFFN